MAHRGGNRMTNRLRNRRRQQVDEDDDAGDAINNNNYEDDDTMLNDPDVKLSKKDIQKM